MKGNDHDPSHPPFHSEHGRRRRRRVYPSAFSIGQADNRPSITIAVQKVTNSNVLDVLREQSNVGERIFFSSIWEGSDLAELARQPGAVPGLATEWRRIDDQTVELKLRQGVKFHNGDEMTAEDVVFSFGRERMFGETEAKNRSTIKAFEQIPTPRAGKELPPEVPASARRIWPDLLRVDAVDKYTVRFDNATPDVTLEGRLSRYGSDIVSRRAWEEAASYLDWARKPVTTGPYKVVEFRPDVSLTLEAHDEYWGGRPPIKRIRFVEVPEVASRINGLAVRRIPVRLRHPAGPDRRDREERGVRGAGRHHPPITA